MQWRDASEKRLQRKQIVSMIFLMANRDQKLLLIGVSGYERRKDGVLIDCVEWSSIRKIANLRDYDTVIFDLLSLKSAAERDKVDWAHFKSVAAFVHTIQVTLHGGMIVTIGDPRFSITYTGSVKRGQSITAGKSLTEPFLNWSGISFSWDTASGDTIINASGSGHWRFDEYLKKFKRWAYSLRSCILDNQAVETAFDLRQLAEADEELVITKLDHSENRYRHSLAFTIEYQLRKAYATESFGPMVFLPEISVNHEETIQLVLRDICAVPTDLPEPEWVTQFDAPGQREIDAEISKINEEMEEAKGKLQEISTKRENSRKCLKLLYEREFALEPVVRETLIKDRIPGLSEI